MANAQHQENTLPVYPWWDQVPEHLLTRGKLTKLRLKPGGPVRALIRYVAHKREREYALYDRNEAIPKVATPGQLAALEKAQRVLRTCKECGRIVERPRQLEQGRCWSCIEVLEQISRKADQDESIAWARRLLLDDPASVVVLDTETTDLHGRLCEIAVIDLAGRVLLDTLVNPETPMVPEAQAIHGITDAMVQDAPTFAQIAPALRDLLRGKRVAAYNADYDYGVLRREIVRLLTAQHAALYPDAERLRGYSATWIEVIDRPCNAWMAEATWIDVMEPYSQAFSSWSEYHGSYSWLPLGGGHRALGDARACLRVIEHLAATPLAIEQRLRKPRARIYSDEQCNAQ